MLPCFVTYRHEDHGDEADDSVVTTQSTECLSWMWPFVQESLRIDLPHNTQPAFSEGGDKIARCFISCKDRAEDAL